MCRRNSVEDGFVTRYLLFFVNNLLARLHNGYAMVNIIAALRNWIANPDSAKTRVGFLTNEKNKCTSGNGTKNPAIHDTSPSVRHLETTTLFFIGFMAV
jgi:hypothetical protein